jgi:hypothetical protein
MLKCSKAYPLRFLVGWFWSFETGAPPSGWGPSFNIRISDFLGVDIRSKLFQFSFGVSFTVSDHRLVCHALLTPSGKPSSIMHPR